jgi:anaerobic magnesium-protoporphyrin IX monomethyl ester cyclase
MKVAFTYPPLESKKGQALLSQNRQFQWSKSPTIAFPVIPASAATLLNKKGHQVLWLDAIAEKLSYSKWLQQLKAFQPDFVFIETKTPVIKQHWSIIKKLKKALPNTKVILAGDHVTALPQESKKNSPVDHILIGGHYDLLLLQLLSRVKPSRGFNPQRPNLNKLPLIDRQLTKWHLYSKDNGNFKLTPATYTMFGRDCWWRKDKGCTFCSWTTIFPQFSLRSVDNCLKEVDQLIDLGVKEIFDDTGTFPAGKWLQDFCKGMIKKGYHKKISIGCNLRFGILTKKDYQLMRRAGFRFLLFGLESANQKTVDKLNKGVQINKAAKELEIIKQVGGLEPHITCMIGYPWESRQDAQNTINLVKNFFKEGLINSLQATIVTPYPGTKLFKQAQKNGWLKTLNWSRYDMKEPILKTTLTNKEIHQFTQSLYTAAITPEFIFRTLKNVFRSPTQLPYYLKSTTQYLARLFDFK